MAKNNLAKYFKLSVICFHKIKKGLQSPFFINKQNYKFYYYFNTNANAKP